MRPNTCLFTELGGSTWESQGLAYCGRLEAERACFLEKNMMFDAFFDCAGSIQFMASIVLIQPPENPVLSHHGGTGRVDGKYVWYCQLKGVVDHINAAQTSLPNSLIFVKCVLSLQRTSGVLCPNITVVLSVCIPLIFINSSAFIAFLHLDSRDSFHLYWAATTVSSTELSSSFSLLGAWWSTSANNLFRSALGLFGKLATCVFLVLVIWHLQFLSPVEVFEFESSLGVAPCTCVHCCWSWLIQPLVYSAEGRLTSLLWSAVFLRNCPVGCRYWSHHPSRSVIQPAVPTAPCILK